MKTLHCAFMIRKLRVTDMVTLKVVAILLLTISGTSFGYMSHILHSNSKALLKLEDYDSSARPSQMPPNENAPTIVRINLLVRSIERIDHFKNEFAVQITLREEWVDPRLSFTGADEISTNEVQMFWKPGIFFSNEKMGNLHSITKPNTFVRIRPNGEVLHSTRISLNLRCQMNLWKFPFDTQTCEIGRIGNYGYNTNDVVTLWENDNPVQISPDMHLQGFTLQGIDTTYCSSRSFSIEYSCLRAFFEFKRTSGAYVFCVYIPLFFLVIASWTSFWLPISQAAMRSSIGLISSVTTALFMFRDANFFNLPVLTSFDVWVGASGFFVFAAFFEYAVIVYLHSFQESNYADGENSGKVVKILWITITPNEWGIDKFSKVIFPICYILFNLIFFSVSFQNDS